MVYVAEADYGWLLVRMSRSTLSYWLHRNLPRVGPKKLAIHWMMASATWCAFGETLANLTRSAKTLQDWLAGQLGGGGALKVQQKVIGLLVVVRKPDRVFDRNMQSLLEAVPTMLRSRLVNRSLFRALRSS